MDLEQIIDEIANRLKQGRDITYWQTRNQFVPITNLLMKLTSFPKSKIPQPNLSRIKNQVLDRIAVPKEFESSTSRSGMFASIPQFLKFASGFVGALLILVSLGIGTAVAALQSQPGQPMYPMKKVVENLELRFTTDPAAKANLQIQFATNRLDELTTVLEKNQSGEISSAEAQKLVTKAVSDLQKSTAAAMNSPQTKKASTLNKLVDLSNKQVAVLQPLLSAASVSNEGEVKIVLEQALETSIVSRDQAIKNIENAGLIVEDQPIVDATTTSKVTAKGKITSLTTDTVSIGTAKFLLTKETQYVTIKNTDLKLDLAVQITGEVRDDKKTYALTISLVETDTKTDTTSPTDSTVTP